MFKLQVSSFGASIAELEAAAPAVAARRAELEAELAEIIARQDAISVALKGLRDLTTVAGSQQVEESATPVSGAEDRALAKTGQVEEPSDASLSEPAQTTADVSREPAAGREAVKKARTRKTVAKKAPSKRVAPSAAGTRGRKAQPAKKASGQPTPRRRTGISSEDVLKVLAAAEAPVRAEEVCKSLGIDTASGNVNSVRTMMERLHKAGRAARPARGQYEAVKV